MSQPTPYPYQVSAHRRADASRPSLVSDLPPDLPGCESFPLPASELERHEGRLEYWDRRIGSTWKVCEPTSTRHEQPPRCLAVLAGRIASVRGSPIKCLGSSDLVRLNAAGLKERLMQADEILYLHPERSQALGPAVNVDDDLLPDVVLEVDHTTDVRRWNLGVYREWRFPEVWVLVPWAESLRAPGLTIHVHLGGGSYREVPESRPFRGGRRRRFTAR